MVSLSPPFGVAIFLYYTILFLFSRKLNHKKSALNFRFHRKNRNFGIDYVYIAVMWRYVVDSECVARQLNNPIARQTRPAEWLQVVQKKKNLRIK